MCADRWELAQPSPVQGNLFAQGTGAAHWESQRQKHALDELFAAAVAYRHSKGYAELMNFVVRFRFYSPYNAFLLHTQRPGARFVAPPSRWLKKYGRTIKPGAGPLVILQPRGPVMFVFDVADTEPGPDAAPLPAEVDRPFEVRGGYIGRKLDSTIENAKRDGIRVTLAVQGSQQAGWIEKISPPRGPMPFYVGVDKEKKAIFKPVPIRYEMVINSNMSKEAQYATVVHELAHLYCGHLGSPQPKWWPDRTGLTKEIKEFEAESTTYLVCKRLGIETTSDEYLSGYMKKNAEIPVISPECVMKAAGLIETMASGRLRPRKDDPGDEV